MIRQAAFDLPAAPPGWDESGLPLIRIVDPSGQAIAWLAPDFGAACVGYAVRRAGVAGEVWTHIFRSTGPPARVGRPGRYGCSILAALPEHQLRPSANDRDRALTSRHRWRLIERDPTMAVVEASFLAKTTDSGRQTSSDSLRLRLAARLDDGTLSLDLVAHNEGATAIPIGLGLRPTFAAGAGPADGDPALDRGVRIGIDLAAGIRHVVVHTPRQQPEVSIALLGYMPARGLVRLPPGARMRVAVSIGVLGEGSAEATV